MNVGKIGAAPLLISMREAAKLLSLSERTVWAMVHSSTLPHVRIKRRVLFSPAALQAWIDAQQRGMAAVALDKTS